MGLTDVVLVLLSLLVSSSVIIGSLSTSTTATYKKVCQGTSNGLSYTRTQKTEVRYNNLRDRYKDCAYVDGNVEIVGFDCGDHMSFLRGIEEITGYLLIVNTCTDRIPLTNLRIIRGRNLYDPQHSMESNRTRNYSLYVAYNFKNRGNDEAPDEGLTSLVLASLTEISAGSVFFKENPRLCFVETIDWTDILSGEGAKVIIEPQVTKSNHCHNKQCPENCTKSPQERTKHCWTRQYCQHFTRVICAKQCSGRCFGENANECCHIECAAGCTGPLDTQCLACKNFNDSHKCVAFCPPLQQYDPASKKYVPRLDGKYAYGTLCVQECPKHMMIDKGACVSDCGSDHYADSERKCTPCGAGRCPKSCPGTGDMDWIHAHNIHRFINCTVIQGCLKIQQSTFNGDEERNISRLTVKDLSVLQNVVEITDYLRVDTDFEDLQSLSFLKNLKIIHGRNLDRGVNALIIGYTKLKRLDLNSLRQVSHGKVTIRENPDLCYAETFNWKLLINTDHQSIEISKNGNDSICEANGFVCSDQCTSDGCMGPGNDQCFNCSNNKFGSMCIESCAGHRHPHLTLHPNSTGFECAPCHEQCLSSCTGVGSHQCRECRHYKDGANCVRNCSDKQYADSDRTCQPCHPLCIGGCKGPDGTLSPSTGCTDCEHVIYREGDRKAECRETSDCPSNYYNRSQPNMRQSQCHLCHPECLSCTGYGVHKCLECRHFKQDGICVASCSFDDHYADAGQCHKCHDECLKCRGPTASDCLSCRLYVVYEDFAKRTPDSKFNCTDSCPTFAANILRDGNRTFCVPDEFVKPDEKKLVAIIAGTICGGVFFIGFLAVIILILRRQVARAEEKKLRLTAKISGFVECEPLTPSNAKPDMAVLRLIKESDLRRSGIIGSGAFGTVYKGLWVPEGENVKIPVAIKVLQEGAGENENLLEEARIMASVLHPSCLHILAVCMTAQVMLVTQLMPLGCLLDYVRKHRDNIGSKVILNWCTQIARGMSYLEERGIIHRDLAARNVLVHSPSHVKITDFGLAKLVNEDGRFLSTGGKLPIKWLALECIRNRIFTHKSDVWSFGVTVWELCTYGQRPYENVNAGDIVNLLEKGERLPQPSICTIDVYMIMIKCWMLGAESRPSFSELAEEFAKMARDPGRYLVIPNDKLMRLPSQPADSRELLRHVSLTLDGPEEVIMADEYVNEHAKKTRFRRMDKHQRDGRQTPIDEEAEKPTLISPGAEAGSDSVSKTHDSKSQDSKSPDPKCQDTRSPNSRARLVPNLELAAVQNRLSSYEANRDSPRYSPDPCSMSYQAAFPTTREDAPDGQPPTGDEGPTPVPPSEIGKKDGVAAEALRIPLDGSDYLQPRSLVPTSYLELVDYGGGAEEVLQFDYSQDPQRKDALPDERTSLLPKTSAIDNPEYFNPPTNTTPLLTSQIR